MTDWNVPAACAQRIEELAEAYGADTKGWPTEEWAAIRVQATQSPEIAEALSQALNAAGSLDTLLELASPLEPSPELQRRVAEIPVLAEQPTSAGSLLGWLGVDLTVLGWKPTLALGLAMALGIVTGALSPSLGTDDLDLPSEASLIVFGSDSTFDDDPFVQ